MIPCTAVQLNVRQPRGASTYLVALQVVPDAPGFSHSPCLILDLALQGPIGPASRNGLHTQRPVSQPVGLVCELSCDVVMCCVVPGACILPCHEHLMMRLWDCAGVWAVCKGVTSSIPSIWKDKHWQYQRSLIMGEIMCLAPRPACCSPAESACEMTACTCTHDGLRPSLPDVWTAGLCWFMHAVPDQPLRTNHPPGMTGTVRASQPGNSSRIRFAAPAHQTTPLL